MIKLNASYGKKVPAEQEYSSKSYMASVEVELPTGLPASELKGKIAETFALVRDAVEAELGGRPESAAATKEPQVEPPAARSGPRRRAQAPEGKASNRQISYILDLGKAREKGLAELNTEALRLYGAESIYDLSRPEASRFVDVLKAAA